MNIQPNISLEGAMKSNSNWAGVKICYSWENFENDEPIYITDALFNKAMENIKYQHKRSSTFQTVFFNRSISFQKQLIYNEHIQTLGVNNIPMTETMHVSPI